MPTTLIIAGGAQICGFKFHFLFFPLLILTVKRRRSILQLDDGEKHFSKKSFLNVFLKSQRKNKKQLQ